MKAVLYRASILRDEETPTNGWYGLDAYRTAFEEGHYVPY
jgi:hypothetical protein